MEFNDLLIKEKIDPKVVLVLRHRPHERKLRKVLPWFAAERPALFNYYQRTQTPFVEKALQRAKYVASFLGHEVGKAVFVGLYKVGNSKSISYKQYWSILAYKELLEHGMTGFSGSRPRIKLFDLELTKFASQWKGKLVVQWSGPRSWSRWASKNIFVVDAILSESCLDKNIPDWRELTLSWQELSKIPKSWESKISEWRSIYFIWDKRRNKGYVGSAYGRENLIGRWRHYASSGHGNNKLLRQSKPQDLVFSILERVSPDMESDEVIGLEASWKLRLGTREYGLNEN
jgi:hypothetical protein